MAEPAGEEPVGEAPAVPALREGYLEKKMKSKLRGFKKRWFVLLPGKLEYYLTEEERAEGKEPKGCDFRKYSQTPCHSPRALDAARLIQLSDFFCDCFWSSL